MKNSSWRIFFVILPLAGLLAWMSTPAYPARPPEPQPAAAAPSAPAPSREEVQELKKLLGELKERETENHTLVLDSERKSIDWWFSFLAVLTALLALLGVFGTFILYLIGRKEREEIAKDKAMIEQDKDEIRKMLEEAKASITQIHQHESETKKILDSYVSGKSDVTPQEKAEIEKAVAATQTDPAADTNLKLRAQAIKASMDEQAETAYPLWHALAKLSPGDADAHFNAGYWAQDMGKKSSGHDQRHWLQQAGVHYAQVLKLEPDAHDALNNWGLALSDEAQAIVSHDVDDARRLWREAGEKYRQALDIKGDDHEALNNWGAALSDEAQVIVPHDVDGARRLWRTAGEKYRQALDIKGDYHEALNNWGSVLSAEARAIASHDVDGARRLWREAGEKYRLALDIKGDFHMAARNWGGVLGREAAVLKPTAPEESQRLLTQAEALLLAHAEVAPEVVAYNLACVHGLRGAVAECLKWLGVAEARHVLPDCEHLKNDADLDGVRASSEFAAWWTQHCGEAQ